MCGLFRGEKNVLPPATERSGPGLEPSENTGRGTGRLGYAKDAPQKLRVIIPPAPAQPARPPCAPADQSEPAHAGRDAEPRAGGTGCHLLRVGKVRSRRRPCRRVNRGAGGRQAMAVTAGSCGGYANAAFSTHVGRCGVETSAAAQTGGSGAGQGDAAPS